MFVMSNGLNDDIRFCMRAFAYYSRTSSSNSLMTQALKKSCKLIKSHRFDLKDNKGFRMYRQEHEILFYRQFWEVCKNDPANNCNTGGYKVRSYRGRRGR